MIYIYSHRNTFQDPQWMPEAAGSTKPYVYTMFFSYTDTPFFCGAFIYFYLLFIYFFDQKEVCVCNYYNNK